MFMFMATNAKFNKLPYSNVRMCLIIFFVHIIPNTGNQPS